MIALSANGQGEGDLKPLSDASIRSLLRPESAGFRKAIMDGLQETFVEGAEGILKSATVGTVDLSRFDRVVARIIKGVFYSERGVRLPSDYRVVNYSVQGLTKIPIKAGKVLQSNIECLIERDPRHVGGPQFLYWSDYCKTDPSMSFWAMVIHRHHFFIGWTVKAESVIFQP